MDKISAKVRFKPESMELPSFEEDKGLNDEYSDSAIGFDGSLNTPESLCAGQQPPSCSYQAPISAIQLQTDSSVSTRESYAKDFT